MESNTNNYKLCFIIAQKYYRNYTSYTQYYVDNIQKFYPGSLCIIVDNNSINVNDIIYKLKDYENVVILTNASKCKFEIGAYKVGISYLITNNLIDKYDYTIFSQDTFVLKNKYDFNELQNQNIMAGCVELGGSTLHYDMLYAEQSQIILKKINLLDSIDKIGFCWCNSFVLHKSKIIEFLNITKDIIIIKRIESEIGERYLAAILYYLNNYKNYGLMDYNKINYECHTIDVINCTDHNFFIKKLQQKNEVTSDIKYIEKNYQINFGISIFFVINYEFNIMIENNPLLKLNITLWDDCIDNCRKEYGEKFKNNYYNIMRCIFKHKNMQVYEQRDRGNKVFTTHISCNPATISKFILHNDFINQSIINKTIYNLPEKYITISTKFMEYDTVLNINDKKQKFFEILNSYNCPIILIGERNVPECSEYNILKPYSYYNDLKTNLNNYLDYTIESSKNNNDLNELYNSIHILNKSKLNLFFSLGSSIIGNYVSNNNSGITSLCYNNNTNGKFYRTFDDFLNILPNILNIK